VALQGKVQEVLSLRDAAVGEMEAIGVKKAELEEALEGRGAGGEPATADVGAPEEAREAEGEREGASAELAAATAELAAATAELAALRVEMEGEKRGLRGVWRK